MTPKSMSSEVENIEIKAKKITRTNLICPDKLPDSP